MVSVTPRQNQVEATTDHSNTKMGTCFLIKLFIKMGYRFPQKKNVFALLYNVHSRVAALERSELV